MQTQQTSVSAKLPQRISHAERIELSDSRMFKAAVKLIVEQGTEKTTLKDVGEIAGYSRGLAGSRFKSKKGLFCFVIKRVADFWLNEMKLATRGNSGYDAIFATTDAHYRFCKQAPLQVRAFYILWFESMGLENEVHEVVLAIHKRRLNDVKVWIEKDIRTGKIPRSVNAESAARHYLLSITGIIYLWLLDPQQDEEIKTAHNYLNETMKKLLLG